MFGGFQKSLLMGVILCGLVFAAGKNYYLPDLLKAADKNNPDIKAEESLLRRYDEEIKLSNMGWVPDMSIGKSLYLDDLDRASSDSTYFSVNISRLFGQGMRVQIAKENYAVQKQQVERVRARVYTEINNAYRNYITHQKRLEILKRTHQSSLNTLTIVRENFANGNLTPDRVMVSQEIVSNLELKMEEEQEALAKIEFLLLTLTGQEG